MAKGGADSGGKAHSLVWAQGLACGVGAALAPTVALMVAVLLGPGLIAMALDHEPTKPVARAITLAGLAACAGPVQSLWASGHGLDISMALISDVSVVGTAWSAAGAAWLLSEVIPIGIRVALEAANMTRAAQLRTARAALAEEWGLSEGAET